LIRSRLVKMFSNLFTSTPFYDIIDRINQKGKRL
jgi:hypothetical protein